MKRIKLFQENSFFIALNQLSKEDKKKNSLCSNEVIFMNIKSPSSLSSSFWDLCQRLQKGRYVDLTHTFDPASPHFENTTPMQVEDLHTYADGGFWVQRFHFEGQWGTHVDAPAHSCPNARTVADIPLQEMILPLVVIDIHEKVQHNPDYALTVNDILEWEDHNGSILKGAFVALRTDWSKRWPDQAAMTNSDEKGVSHTPGISLDALSYLYDSCGITASGHETFDPDPGYNAKSTNWACEQFILKRNHFQIELMTNLDQCPSKGAIIICSFPKPAQASGFPARVFAICPPIFEG